jgi:predicted alpha/beta hydrolase family esterase
MTFKNREGYLDYLKNKKVRLSEKISWHGDYLKNKLGEDFQIISPRMPLMDNAKYEDWKIVFENYLEAMDNNFILIGTSLGGIFLAKYLSKNKINKKILSVYLVAPPFDDESTQGEDLVGGFELDKDLSLIEKNCSDITLMFSEDDESVPEINAKKYREKLKNSKIIVYKSKNGHFQIEEFPEIVKMIKEDVGEIL